MIHIDLGTEMNTINPECPDQPLNSTQFYPPLVGFRKWVRYAWHPIIDLLSFAGAMMAILSLLQDSISWVDLGIMLAMFNIIGLSGEAGMHRLFAHKSYKTSKPIRIFLAVSGTMVGEAPIIEYVAYHRCHHLYADQVGDLHSPHHLDGQGVGVTFKNIWHTFIGWKYNPQTNQIAAPDKYAKDMLADPAMMMINNSFYAIVLASFALPAFLGFLFTGTAQGAWTGFLWGGCFRFVVMTLMGDLIVRAGCHLIGASPFIDPVHSDSRNLWLLAIPSLGLSWHNNHHAFPDSALLNIDWWQIDPSGSFITILEKLGLAWKVNHPTPKQIKARRKERAAV